MAGLKVFRWWANDPRTDECRGAWFAVASSSAHEAARLFRDAGADGRPTQRSIEMTADDGFVEAAMRAPGRVWVWAAAEDEPWQLARSRR